MSPDSVRRAAERTFDLDAMFGISVEGVLDTTAQEACRGERVADYQQVRLSTFGRDRAGFAVLATFDRPHFTLVLPDLSDLTLARLDRCFDEPIPNPGRARPVARWPQNGGHAVAASCDIAVDFMDMTNDRRLWARRADLRGGFEPVVGRYAVVGDDDADPKLARIVAIDPEGNLELEVLSGSVESHLDLLALG